ncbi:hypothetical protein CHUV2995_02727 [Corynebacterium diphtheriae subsp. lausannense]|nr:hypothetical protein FRC0043_00967 [Corynebacterium belfantii]SPJ41897.1 hypothetical protein CHUV2995_02727 [Corynebacterium diphtheriae subsp. lausannense]STC67892.1 Uncharacterised protein [Corynebacterium diphtheriae]
MRVKGGTAGGCSDYWCGDRAVHACGDGVGGEGMRDGAEAGEGDCGGGCPVMKRRLAEITMARCS